jgi:hypothetical protein
MNKRVEDKILFFMGFLWVGYLFGPRVNFSCKVQVVCWVELDPTILLQLHKLCFHFVKTCGSLGSKCRKIKGQVEYVTAAMVT